MGCLNSTKTEENIQSQKLKHRISQSKNIDVRKNYEFISMLGNGAYGKVRLYIDRNYRHIDYKEKLALICFLTDAIKYSKKLEKKGNKNSEYFLMKINQFNEYQINDKNLETISIKFNYDDNNNNYNKLGVFF